MKSALHTTTAVMGAWMGLAGIEHGIGELLQGRTGGGGMILSWPDSPFFASLSGEPAFTLLGDMRLTGALAVVISVLFIAWSIGVRDLRRGGAGMMLLAVPMFLFGGGIFPPVLGFIIGLVRVCGGGMRQREVRSSVGRFLGKHWRWIFGACICAWLVLLPGTAVMGYFFGVDDAGFIVAVIVAAFGLMGLSFWSARLHDRMVG